MDNLTVKIVQYLLWEEGLTLSSYKDSGGVWTAFLGVTNASGHQVAPRYVDKPQTLETALAISIWLLREKYLPSVIKAMGDNLTESQLAAALSFHWNTGAIQKVKSNFTRAGLYTNKGLLAERRTREQKLFFNNEWPNGFEKSSIIPVSKTYSPMFSKAKKADLTKEINEALSKN